MGRWSLTSMIILSSSLSATTADAADVAADVADVAVADDNDALVILKGTDWPVSVTSLIIIDQEHLPTMSDSTGIGPAEW